MCMTASQSASVDQHHYLHIAPIQATYFALLDPHHIYSPWHGFDSGYTHPFDMSYDYPHPCGTARALRIVNTVRSSYPVKGYVC